VRGRIEYHFRVPNTTVFTLYLFSKALEYALEYPLDSLIDDVDGVLGTQLCSACSCSAGLFFSFYKELVSGVSVEQ
jgi:hypothetical protein